MLLTRVPTSPLHAGVTEGRRPPFSFSFPGSSTHASVTLASYGSLGNETPDWDHPHVRCPANALHNAYRVHLRDADGEISSLQNRLEDVTFHRGVA